MSLYGTPPVLDLLSGDTRVSLSLMEPPANVMKRVSRESGSTDLSVSTIDWDVRRVRVQLDVIEGWFGSGVPTQSCPIFYPIQEPLDLINVVFCHARVADQIVDVFGECLALALKLMKLDGGNELESLAERRGAGAVERYRLG